MSGGPRGFVLDMVDGESPLRREQRGSSSPKSTLHSREAQRENMSFRLGKENAKSQITKSAAR